jgi:hypothetical protein
MAGLIILDESFQLFSFSYFYRQMFEFPAHVDRIDALYERSADGRILLFTGDTYWITDGSTFVGKTLKALIKILTANFFRKKICFPNFSSNTK